MQRNLIKEKNSKLYLIKSTSFTGENLDVSTLRYLTYIRGDVELAYTCLIDVEQREINWGTGGEQYLECYPEYVDSKFTLTEAEITDWGWWKIGMEFADGTIITVWGSVISDEKSKPEWYDEVVACIEKMGTELK